MSTEREDPRELEALREEARKQLAEANRQRLSVLSDFQPMNDLKLISTAGYIDHVDPKIIKFLGQHDLIARELDIARLAADMKIEEGIPEQKKIYFSRLMEVVGPSSMKKFAGLSDEASIAEDRIADLRALAVLAERSGEKSFCQGLKKEFMANLFYNYRSIGIQVPDYWKFILSRGVKESISLSEKEFGDPIKLGFEIGLQKRLDRQKRQLKKRGLHSAMIERIVESTKFTSHEKFAKHEKARRESMKFQLESFARAYKDPRIFIDETLALRDGKLPI